jgi:hypothetical protein
MTAPLSKQKKAALWRAYKKRQTANYVARSCKVSPHTAQKYIRELKFAERSAKLQEKANDLRDDDQARALAEDIKILANIKSLLAEAVLSGLRDKLKLKEFQPGTAEYDRLVRLERFLRGEPESHAE